MPKVKKEKEETAIVKIADAKIAEDKHKKFRDNHEEKFFVIRDHELADIILEHVEDITLKGLCRLLGWEEKRGDLIPCMNCKKSTGQTLKLGSEKDFILHLVKEDILPEGNYMVLVT